MRRLVLILLASTILAGGCSQPVGDGLWNLKLGGKAG